MKKNLNFHKKIRTLEKQGPYFFWNKSSITGFIIARIIDAKIAVENESIIAPLDKLKAVCKTIAFTIKENNPKVIIVKGSDNSFKIGFIIALTNTKSKAVIIIALFSVNDIPENKISSI